MTTPIFPALKGLDWNVQHDFDWSGNTVVESVSGKRTARANWSYPRHVFTLAYTFLRADPSLAEYQALAGFFNAMQGQFGTFLYQDATDNAVAGQVIGIGDGVTTTFQLIRAFGGFLEPCFAPNVVSAVYLAGAPLSLGWSVTPWGNAAPGVITFGAPPAAGQPITADFSYYFPCRFDNPKTSFKNFAKALYSADGIQFSSEK